MKSTFSLVLLAATTLAVAAAPSSAARGGHAGGANSLPRRRHHARRAANAASTDIPSETVASRSDAAAPAALVDRSVVDARASSSYTIPDGWSYKGCVLDASSRLLTDYSFFEDDMTADLCLSACGDHGYAYGGVEWKTQCFCGNTLNSYAGISLGGLLGDIACSETCTDGSPCGGYWSLSLFTTGASSGTVSSSSSSSAPTATSTSSAAASWPSQGCITDASDRTLQGYTEWIDAGWTAATCVALCQSKGYTVAGIEVQTQCYCSDQADVDNVHIVSDSACNWSCKDSDDMCGGNWKLSIYSDKSLDVIIAGSASTTTTSAAAAATSTSSSSAPSSSSSSSAVPSSSSSSVVDAATTTAPASSTAAPASSGNKKVYVHQMVGNTYPYTYDTWMSNIKQAAAAGFDGFALNVGSDYWQWAQVATAYQAAADSGTGFEMFMSLDMTVLPCSATWHADQLKSYVSTYASHSAQAYYDGKQLVSTFAGSDCLFGYGDWNSGWEGAFKQPLKNAGHDIFFLPSIFTDPSTFGASVLDGELNWNSGWPTAGTDLDFSSDTRYINALGSKAYMAAVSPAFYTHYGANSWNKNWQYRSDNWLYSYRWEQLVANRDQVNLIEALTWNDYGESSYIGPIDGAQPNSQSWVDGFDHTALLEINKYYATAFKTGSYPAITVDKVYLMARPHPVYANAWADSVGPPTGREYSQDHFYALVFATAASTVTLSSGAGSQTFAVDAGVTRLSYALQAGSGMSATIARNGADVVSFTPAFTFEASPAVYNFNSHIMASS